MSTIPWWVMLGAWAALLTMTGAENEGWPAPEPRQSHRLLSAVPFVARSRWAGLVPAVTVTWRDGTVQGLGVELSWTWVHGGGDLDDGPPPWSLADDAPSCWAMVAEAERAWRSGREGLSKPWIHTSLDELRQAVQALWAAATLALWRDGDGGRCSGPGG